MEGVGLSNVSALANANVRRVSFANNRITAIPAGAFFTQQLEFLKLQHNEIAELPLSTLQFSPNVIAFDASHNRLRDVPATLFQQCSKSIRKIALNNNQLTRVPSALFRNLISLHHLKIQNNKITSLHNGMFKDAVYLRLISANDNLITHISPEMVAGLTRLHTLSMASKILPWQGLDFHCSVLSMRYLKYLLTEVYTLTQFLTLT